MSGVIEVASSGRAKCRACSQAIGKGELRFGERGPNPFGEGEATYWFHLRCAACKRPEAALESLEGLAEDVAERDVLVAIARRGVEHTKLPRFAGVQRSPSNRARCRHCRETIDKGLFRITLDWWEDGRFGGAGYVHAACAAGYFGATDDIETRMRWLDPSMSGDDVAAAMREIGTPTGVNPAP